MAKFRAVCLTEMISLGSFPTHLQAQAKADQHKTATGDNTTVESPVPSAGEHLMTAVMKPNNIKTASLAKAIQVDKQKMGDILTGKGKINASLALRLGRALNVKPQDILKIQAEHDLHNAKFDKHLSGINPLI